MTIDPIEALRQAAAEDRAEEEERVADALDSNPYPDEPEEEYFTWGEVGPVDPGFDPAEPALGTAQRRPTPDDESPQNTLPPEVTEPPARLTHRPSKSVGLPARLFLYTLDQVAQILSLKERELTRRYVYFDRVDEGRRPLDRMLARNIGTDDRPDWRITEIELIRWMKKVKGFRIYERGWASE